MSEQVEKTPQTSWRDRFAAPFIAVFAIACCLGAPLIVGGLGAVSLGALFGVLAGMVALAILCFAAFRMLASDRC